MRQWGEDQHYRDFGIVFLNNLLKTCLKIKKVKENIFISPIIGTRIEIQLSEIVRRLHEEDGLL